jgi:hypothetical protein
MLPSWPHSGGRERRSKIFMNTPSYEPTPTVAAELKAKLPCGAALLASVEPHDLTDVRRIAGGCGVVLTPSS